MTTQRGYSPYEWEHFRHKQGEEVKYPVRFTLCGMTHNVGRWVELYETLLLDLERRCPKLFCQLPDTYPFNSHIRTRRFTRVREEVEDPPMRRHGEPLKLPGGDVGHIYCKGSMDVKDMFRNICDLLKLFDISEREMVIYLRQDRDA